MIRYVMALFACALVTAVLTSVVARWNDTQAGVETFEPRTALLVSAE